MIRYKLKDEKEEEVVLTLGVRRGIETIILTATDDRNREWNVLEFYPNGTFRRCTGLSKAIGLRLNENGKIIEKN